jgi:hypothetical protein
VSNAIPISTFAVAGNIYLSLALGYTRFSSSAIVDSFLKTCPHTKNVGVGAFEKGDLYTKKRVGQALSSLGLKGAGNMPGD